MELNTYIYMYLYNVCINIMYKYTTNMYVVWVLVIERNKIIVLISHLKKWGTEKQDNHYLK
jgi:hypothetical protein